MAHFAELDNYYIVKQVIVIDNCQMLDGNGQEDEQIGINYIKKILPSSERWVQTSYNNNFRIRYAGIGMKYYEEYDGFGWPNPPEEFPSWVLNTKTLEWIPPIPFPTENPNKNYFWAWDEKTTTWIQKEIA